MSKYIKANLQRSLLSCRSEYGRRELQRQHEARSQGRFEGILVATLLYLPAVMALCWALTYL